MLKDMTESQVKEKIEALMTKYNVNDLYTPKWVINPFDASRGIDIIADGGDPKFVEELCKEFTDYDMEIYASISSFQIIGESYRPRVMDNLKQIYKDGKCIC